MSESTRPLLIVNPNAGGGKARRLFPEIRPVVERALGEVDVAFTDQSGHAIELARDAAAAGRTLLVAVGGDGTLNEVVNGVMTAHPSARPAIGFIGQGTGGDFRKTLGIEHRLDRYVEAIASGRTRPTDVGWVHYRDRSGEKAHRYFVNILSAGMGGLVDRYVADASRSFGPTLAYFGASLRALGAIERGRLRLRIKNEGQEREERLGTYMIAICNGRYFGSGMNVAPMAEIDDGRLEVVSIGGEGKLAFALTARSIYSGAHLGKRGTVHLPCQRISIELENARDAGESFLIDCDGEPIGGLPIEIEVMPRAVSLRA
jgi:YegS/Rv2252/BmrU family lipid kinase